MQRGNAFSGAKSSTRGPSRQNGGLSNQAKRSKAASNSQKQARAASVPKARGGGGSGRQAAAAAAYATGQVSKAPVIVASRDTCRIVHRELVGNLTGSVAFAVAQTFALNPGLAASFPWLATQAQGWQAYRFNKLKYCYYTRTGSNIPGSVALVPDYDAADPAPATEQIASSYEDVAEDAPWKDIECNLRVRAMDTLGPRHFVRTGALAANQDLKTFDVGQLFVCTVDGTAVSWGKLWVEYDINFYTPQLQPTGLAPQSATMTAGGGTIAAATPFGAVPVSVNSAVTLTGAATNVITVTGLVTGLEYQMDSCITGTVISAITYSTPVGWTSKTVRFFGFPAAATSGAISSTFTATATTATIVLTITATTVTNSTVVVTLIPTSTF